MKKKLVLMLVAAAFVLTAIIGGTFAAYNTEGNNTTKVMVEFDDMDVALAAGLPEGTTVSGPFSVLPGDIYTFETAPFVAHDKDYDYFVRVTIDKQWDINSSKFDELDPSVITLDFGDALSSGWFTTNTSPATDEQVILYYSKPLTKGDGATHDVTAPFLKGFTLDGPKTDNTYAEQSFSLSYKVDVIQAAHVDEAMPAEWGVTPVLDENGNLVGITE